MNVSCRWLQEWIDLSDHAPQEIADLLTRHGVAVDAVRPLNPGVSGVVVGEVLEVSPHPEADRLKVCRVEVGRGEPLQIVCGAPNVRPGQRVPTALPGAKLPGTEIGEAVFRGVVSQGMLCSAKELGLDVRLLPKEQTEGLYVLPADAPVGRDVAELFGWDDAVLELDLTPNRADCLSVVGVAYELSAVLNRPLRFPDWTEGGVGEGPSPVRVSLETSLCGRYAAQVVRGVRFRPSPLWMQMRLLAAGIRPINAVVDATNYVMLELGQPLHAFDLDEVRNGHIRVRLGREGERLVTLDGVERSLDGSMVVIADEERAIGLAGVMGGENSEITEKTSRIVLESAWFDPGSVRRTAKKLGLRSEAAIRFEKGVDPSVIPAALARAARFIVEHAGGELEGSPVDVGPLRGESRTILVRPAKVNEWLGMAVPEEEMKQILKRLGFGVERRSGEVWEVGVPSRRRDISREIDLAEEIARIYGYDRIPATMPKGPTTAARRTVHQRIRREARSLLAGLGLAEVWTYALQSPDAVEKVGRMPEEPDPVALLHPMSEERSVLRTSLLPGLLDVLAYNARRDREDAAIFEIGRVFRSKERPLRHLPEEREQIGMALMGRFGWRSLGSPAVRADFFAAKGVVETLLRRLGVIHRFVPDRRAGLHPGRTARVWAEKGPIGWVGALHPDVEERWGLSGVLYAELDIGAMVENLSSGLTYRPLPRFPGVWRDVALLVPLDRPAGEVEEAIRSRGGPWLQEIRLFDVYEGPQIPPGRRSLAFSLLYRAEDRTLTDGEVNEAVSRMLEALRPLDIQLRAE